MLALLIGSAGAWEILENRHGSELAWVQMPVPVSVVPANDIGLDEDGVVLALAVAVSVWEGAGVPTVRFADMGELQAGSTEHDAQNTIYFTHDWPHDPSLLALTSTWSTADGVIVGFDMAINANQPWSLDGRSGTYDLQNMITHELGHVLGLGHTGDQDATMHPTSVLREVMKRDLTPDDRDGLAYQYGHLDEEVDLTGCATGGGGMSFAAIFGLTLLGRRRED